MTTPHPMHHRPDCPRTATTSSRVGSWLITRCKDCRSTSVEKAESTKHETTPTDPNVPAPQENQ